MIIALQTLIFFRESLLTALDRLLRPYYNRFTLSFNKSVNDSDDDESEEQVFAEYDEEKGVVFYPPMYAQRYAAVSDCLIDERWCGKLVKVADLGHHDMSFIKYLKDVPGIQCILGVDIETIPLRCSSDLLACDDYIPKRENPLLITLFQGNAADPDYRLIGCDAVIAIEMIEHMLPHDLDRLVHTVFGFIKPWVVIFTTPNGDFNVLFKSLEKNGLRRLDHFFEWSREQYHDWCSNIVVRYPQYIVTCKGIGPGPPGTEHIGCCTQMALFVSKDYHKQQDLSLNSLALVASPPSQNNMSDVLGNWDIPDFFTENNMLCPTSNMASYTEFFFSNKQSRVTIVIASPNYSIESVRYQDKTSQCNLDTERERSYLMFDDEQMCFNVLVPRRKYDNKVYEIEDVTSRLNCTTLQVKKFSKATQNLMAKNQSDTLLHTREVVDEIRNLTKMLNFNKDTANHGDESHPWCNINWGENAPYWNQYYKIVREYNYPFEVKSEDSRMLDLISEEINCLVDTQCEDEYASDVNKLEIPLQYLMKVVKHITDDVDRVKDLLEWNGYEIVDDVVIHTRLVDNASVATHEDESQDNETLSDWDTTDIHSNSLSDGSNEQDYHGRCLRRALDHKLRKLRSMLTADEDISTELDRVVCRLMKLALRMSRDRDSPPPTKWMQSKLLDLLTLTEKSIDRRKRHFIESYPLTHVGFDHEMKRKNMIALEKIKEDDAAKEIVDKYRHLVHVLEEHNNYEEMTRPKYGNLDLELEDDLSEISDFEYINRPSPDLVHSDDRITESSNKSQPSKDDAILERTQTWIEEDIEVVPYPNHDYENISGDNDHGINNAMKGKYKKSIKKNRGSNKKLTDLSDVSNKEMYQNKYKVKQDEKNRNKDKIKNAKVTKKLSQKNSSYSSLLKSSSSRYLTIKFGSYKVKSKKYKGTTKVNTHETPDLDCYKDEQINDVIDNIPLEKSMINDYTDKDYIPKHDFEISATEESCFVGIIMDGVEESIALRRTIGTDAEADPIDTENKTSIDDLHEDSKDFCVRHEVSTENVQSQTIFLNDINEPSTSKGIRHGVNTDVQCGPDISAPLFPTLSATTSFTSLPKICNNGIKIEDSMVNFEATGTDFGTCTYDCNVYGTVTSRKRSPGIRIQDSDKCICDRAECSTMTQESPYQENIIAEKNAANETKLLKAVSSKIRNEDSISEICGSVYSFPKSPCTCSNSVNTSDIHIERSPTKEVEVAEVLSFTKYVRPKLSCGGVHIHAYREKQVSEDVVFQGEWQKYRPKAHYKRKPINSFVAKKGVEPGIKRRKVNSKEKLANTVAVQIKPETKKPVSISTVENKKPKPERKKEVKVGYNTSSRTVRPVKVASKLNVSSNTLKIPKVTFAKKIVAVSSVPAKKDHNKQTNVKKNYIPLYLRKKDNPLQSYNKNCLNSSIDTVKKTINEHKLLSLTNPPPLVRSKTEEIKRDLLKFNLPMRNKVEYMVFHNEVENKGSPSSNQPVAVNYNIRNNTEKKPQSSQSQHSSTCSSPSSVATVRVTTKKGKNPSSRRNSSTSNKSNLNASGSETPSPTRPKKFTKRKSVKKVDENVVNKENIPESARKCNNLNKDFDKTGKSVFIGSHKSVYIAQLKTDNLSLQSSVNTGSKSRTLSNKSDVKIPIAEVKNEKQRSSSSFSAQNPLNEIITAQLGYSINQISKLSVGSRDFEINNQDTVEKMIENQEGNKSLESNIANESTDYINKDEPGYTTNSRTETIEIKNLIENNSATISRNCSIKNKIERSKNIITNPRNQTDELNTATGSTDLTNKFAMSYENKCIAKTIKEIIEDSLDFIDESIGEDSSFDSATIILSLDDTNPSYDDTLSLASFKTINTNDDYFESILESDLENALNRTLDSTIGDETVINLAETSFTLTDVDLLSYKSVPSVSKLSEYALNSNEIKIEAINNSFRELFERKELPLNKNIGGVLAIQAFSGFSLNAEPVVGDQPDHINFIDSEVGSLKLEYTRQATSEELFVSGRSSDSYESCVIDEDAVVPNWLFQIISQQQSANEQPQQMELIDPLPMDMSVPLAEPLYDANGNLVEPGIGAGAGAGDGRGIHSDQSQDSSGRGSSLSSSNTSSDPHSEAAVIDPSAFTTQYEFLGEPVGGNIAISTLNATTGQFENLVRVDEVAENDAITLRVPTEGPVGHQMAASDVDADVSSLDTDVPDSSDN